jgi:hypothetical protein
VIGGNRTPDDRAGRGADDDLGEVVGHPRAAQAACEAEQPGDEEFAAAAEHE